MFCICFNQKIIILPRPSTGTISKLQNNPARFRECANRLQVSSLRRHCSRNVGHGHGFCILLLCHCLGKASVLFVCACVHPCPRNEVTATPSAPSRCSFVALSLSASALHCRLRPGPGAFILSCIFVGVILRAGSSGSRLGFVTSWLPQKSRHRSHRWLRSRPRPAASLRQTPRRCIR